MRPWHSAPASYGNLAGVLNRRTTLRAVLALAAAALAVAGLSGCRTDPTVAAYVGNQQISVRQLDDAVAQRKAADPAVVKYAEANSAQFTRQVLKTLIDRAVYQEAARRYGVSVDAADVRARYAELVAAQGTDEATLEQGAAQAGVTRDDLLEQARNIVIAERIGAASGQGNPLTEAALRQRYQQELPSLTHKPVGIISVPDQATATAVLGQLTADPASYPTVAAAHAGQNTLPTMQVIDTSQIRSDVAEGITAAAANTGFVVPVQGVVVVVFVGPGAVPTYEEVRPQLVAEAKASLDKAGAALVDKVENDLHVSINPRYGELESGKIQPVTGGAVDILGGSGGSGGTGGAAPTGASGG